MTEHRFSIHGRRIAVVPSAQGWQAYLLGDDGKRRKAEIVVPDFIAEDELLQFLADLLHECATPTSGGAVRLP